MPQVDEVEDQLWIQHQWHITAFGSSGPLLSVSDDFGKFLRDRQQRAARAKGSVVPLLLDPKKILDFIDLWKKDPNTPLPELNLTPFQSIMLRAFISEEKWKFEKAGSLKKAQCKKLHFLKDNVLIL